MASIDLDRMDIYSFVVETDNPACKFVEDVHAKREWITAYLEFFGYEARAHQGRSVYYFRDALPGASSKGA